MNKLKKLFLSLLVLFASLIIIPYLSNAETTHEVTNQESLISAIKEAVDGDIIKLTNNIELTKPVSIADGKKLTINGDGKTISKADEGWEDEGPNGSLLTAGGEETKLTLTNITLKNAKKYGVQSYNGAHVVLNDVTVTNNGFGGVLVNAGTVEIVKLHLGKNGKDTNNGIEIGKGDATEDKVPELIMNGTLTSDENTNVIYIATNNEKLTNFTVKNTDTTTDKILVQGNKVVITDKDNKVLFKSNENSNLTFSGEEFKEETTTPDNSTNGSETGNPSGGSETTIIPDNSGTQTPSNTPATQTPPATTTQTTTVKDETPKTGLSNIFAIVISILSISIIATTLSKNKKEL